MKIGKFWKIFYIQERKSAKFYQGEKKKAEFSTLNRNEKI